MTCTAKPSKGWKTLKEKTELPNSNSQPIRRVTVSRKESDINCRRIRCVDAGLFFPEAAVNKHRLTSEKQVEVHRADWRSGAFSRYTVEYVDLWIQKCNDPDQRNSEHKINEAWTEKGAKREPRTSSTFCINLRLRVTTQHEWNHRGGTTNRELDSLPKTHRQKSLLKHLNTREMRFYLLRYHRTEAARRSRRRAGPASSPWQLKSRVAGGRQ